MTTRPGRVTIFGGQGLRLRMDGWHPSHWQVRIGGWEPRSATLKFVFGSILALLALAIVLFVVGGFAAPAVGLALLFALGTFIFTVGATVVFTVGVTAAAVLLPLALCLAPLALVVWVIWLVLHFI